MAYDVGIAALRIVLFDFGRSYKSVEDDCRADVGDSMQIAFNEVCINLESSLSNFVREERRQDQEKIIIVIKESSSKFQ